jgi:4-amino-4-deoxy-L-arabinose transferase-like glycosyltransferase
VKAFSTHPAHLAAGGLAALSGLLFARALGTKTNYDEGVYLASIDALRHGQHLGRDLYTVQPPAFYSLARVLAAPFGHSVSGIRLGFVLVAVLGVLAAYVVGSRLFGHWAGLAAAAFVAIGPPYPTVAPTVAADVPSIAFGIAAVALAALAVRPGAHRGWAAAAGGTMAFAVLVKFLAVPFAVPLAAVILAARAGKRLFPLVAAGGVAVTAGFLLINLGGLDEVWRGVVTDHANAQAMHNFSDNVGRIRGLLHPHTPFAWLVPAGLLAFVVSPSARRTWPLATIVPVAMAFTIYQRPLNDHHLVLMSAAYALAAGPALALAIERLPGRVRLTAITVVCLFVAAGFFQEERRLARNDIPELPETSWAVQVVAAASTSGELVASDQPIVNFLARRDLPGYLSDTSNTRISSQALTPAAILAEVDRTRPPAVVVARMFTTLPELLAGLDQRYLVRLRCGTATVYLNRPLTVDSPACPV